MSSYGVVQAQAYSAQAGPTITAAALTECLDGLGRFPWSPLPPPKVNDLLRFTMEGIISCVVTTPGTARFGIYTAPTSGILIADSGAINLNTTAKTNVPFRLEVLIKILSIGSNCSNGSQLLPLRVRSDQWRGSR